MSADPNVALGGEKRRVRIGAEIAEGRWLDNGKPIEVQENSYPIEPFAYGSSMVMRVAKLKLK